MRLTFPPSQSHWPLVIALLAFALIPAAVSRFPIPAKPAHASKAIPNQATTPLVSRYIVFSHPGVSLEEFNLHKDAVMALLAKSNKVVQALRSAALVESASEQYDEPFYVRHDYSFGGVHGYSGSFDQETINFISSQTELINIVENDKLYHIYDEPSHIVQHGATWGIARTSHHKSNGHTDADYTYPSSAGKNVMAYIIDTGIYTNHSEFEGRAQWGVSFVGSDTENFDGNGHGTHVAGTVGGKIYGVAKKISLMAVKVMDDNGSGFNSDIIKGIEWAVNHHLERVKNDARARSVVNMSLGGRKSSLLDDAVNFAVSKGLHFVVAAGNSYSDACLDSPAGATGAITVGASNDKDQLACFSNHGSCVDVIAPGEEITSSWNEGSDSVNTLSGTSMASPHVCGALALILSEHPDHFFSHTEIVKKLVNMSTKKILHKMPPKNHFDFPSCPDSSDRLNKVHVASRSSLHVVQGGDITVDFYPRGEGKTPNRLLYVLEDDHKQGEQNDSKMDAWERFAKYVVPKRRNRHFGSNVGFY